MPFTHAAPRAGVTARTAFAWLRRGEDEAARIAEGEPPQEREAAFVAFAEAVAAAKADAVALALERVHRGATGGHSSGKRSFPV